MKDTLLISELKTLLKKNSKNEYLCALKILEEKKERINQAMEVDFDLETRNKYIKILKDIETVQASIHTNRNDYFADDSISKDQMDEYILKIDKIWEDLYQHKVKYESWPESHQFSYFNLAESMAVIRSKNYSSIFYAREIIALESLREKFQSLWINRSFLCGELLILGKNEYQNLDRYIATELGYSDRESIPFSTIECEYFRVNKTGRPINFVLNKNKIHFRHISCFQ